MKELAQVYRNLNLLSIDVVCGSLAGMYLFAHLLRTPLSKEVYLLLALVVWLIYTLDHLLDARYANNIPSTARHAFHLKYSKVLWGMVFLVSSVVLSLLILCDGLQVLILPGILAGIVIALPLLISQFWLKKLSFLKELIIAIGYVVGISQAPIIMHNGLIPQETYYIAGLYTLVAYVNLLMLSFADKETDKNDGFEAITTWLNAANLKALINGIFLITCLLALVLFVFLRSYFHIYTSLLLLIFMIHLRLFYSKNRSIYQKRLLTEASFVLPALLVFF
ncbi:hypothetical protein ACFOUP_13765 [Belliella kenyensis]|uniref:UbiA prenyltransferase family protein n=1 Tax=Belliella kenyensis TaxID=1472724 RepID=A0ABV8EMQ6_9BACT|nr:hypothetical protein [Belliella kenyensis]MCH7401509.1 hypothetical protein [Belliella kenyensis]MDN3603210.1 hypothetical protein [Belliella kenyensis]